MGVVATEQLDSAKDEAASTGEGVVDLLVKNHVIRPQDVAQAKAAHFGYELVDLANMRLPDDVIAAVPRHLAKRYRAVPVSKQGSTVAIALADPSDLDTIDSLQRLVHGDLELRVALDEDIDA